MIGGLVLPRKGGRTLACGVTIAHPRAGEQLRSRVYRVYRIDTARASPYFHMTDLPRPGRPSRLMNRFSGRDARRPS